MRRDRAVHGTIPDYFIAYLMYDGGGEWILDVDSATLKEGEYQAQEGVKDSRESFLDYASEGCGPFKLATPAQYTRL